MLKVELDGADMTYLPDFLGQREAQTLFVELRNAIAWQQQHIRLFGKQVREPRLVCWMADKGIRYGYSGKRMTPAPWHPQVMKIKQQVESVSGELFNSVLLNYYRDGNDSNGWHSDDEPELGNEPVIASLSLGAARDFRLRSRYDHSQTHTLHLTPGSLLVMAGRTQADWQHALPKRANTQARINLTYRKILT